MAWRTDVVGQIANTDVDGLLSAALLWEVKGWPLWGFCDTESVWVTAEGRAALQERPENVAWVDLDMCWPRTRSISQHIIVETPADAEAVKAFRTTSNPNLHVNPIRSRRIAYQRKYPFGTFQWMWWVAGLDAPDPDIDAVRTGLLWMPDGGFQSIHPDRHQDNCRDWAVRLLPGSPLAPLVEQGRDEEATDLVVAAHQWLTKRVPSSSRRWFNHQYKMARIVNGSSEVLLDPASREGRDEVNAILSALCEAFGWSEPVQLQSGLERFTGRWRSSPRAPPDWPNSANDGRVVSVAVGFGTKWFFTEPDNGRGVPSLRDLLPPVG